MSDEIYLLNKKTNIIEKVPNYDIIDNIYFQKHRVPSDEELLNSGSELKSDDIKNDISKLEYKIPLYDEYTKNIYLIDRTLVYDKVIYNYHRFPNKEVLNKLKKDKNILENNINKSKEIDKDNKDNNIQKKFYEELYPKKRLKKIMYMIDFLEQFNLVKLEETYIKVFYYYSNYVGKNITNCVRPSFLPYFKHIKPYYTRSEIINLALNMNIIEKSNIYYNDELVSELCEKVSSNDVSAKIILKHHKHIIVNNKLGLIQYYTLQGSFFMNRYLRNTSLPKNVFLENIIESVYKLIKESPPFDKNYIVYRFIKDDSYLQQYKVGDIYINTSIESTTRNPFYSKSYQFGFNLIKIKIPKDKIGVGLCIESVSNFPSEEEILLCPGSKLLLINKDNNVKYYRTDNTNEIKFITRYEFEYKGRVDITFPTRILSKPNKIVNFLKLNKNKNLITITEKINKFLEECVNDIYQFDTMIGNTKYTIINEWYNSTNTYANYYAAKNNNGFAMYTILDDSIGFTIEIGEDNGISYMFINYYFRFSSIPKNNKISDLDLVKFCSEVAYYFDINHVTLFCEYEYCRQIEIDEKIFTGGNYCVDFYHYIKSGIKKYKGISSIELKPIYNFFQLDHLKTIKPTELFKNNYKGELYQIYNLIFKDISDNIADFYIWIIENNCVLISELIKLISDLYDQDNPFLQDYYILDPMSFLYNRNLINEYKVIKKIDIYKNFSRLDLNNNTEHGIRTDYPQIRV